MHIFSCETWPIYNYNNFPQSSRLIKTNNQTNKMTKELSLQYFLSQRSDIYKYVSKSPSILQCTSSQIHQQSTTEQLSQQQSIVLTS